MSSILTGLNDAQHTAVTSPSDVLQILAPPGSGKTKTLTSRVAYLLRHSHYKPWNIICLTFTIKSSREMKDRLAKLLGNGTEKRLILGTFHSVCRRYLVTYGHLIGLRKDFGIADSSDTISILKRIIKRLHLSIDPRKAQTRISRCKARGVSYGELAQEKSVVKNKEQRIEQQEIVMTFEVYEKHLARSNLLDYDDLLLRCADLLRLHPTCVSNVEVVLIDEFQDTNTIQFELMNLFAAYKERLTTVGDPDQSIYGWRSAEIKNLERMQNLYPDTLVIHLKENYRSSGAILLAAYEVIEQDPSRPSKPLLPTHCPGTVPVLRRLPSSEEEAAWIVSEIQRTIALTGEVLEFSDFAILLRSASLSRHIESAMGKAGIPYRMVGGQRFFDRVEVKILLDYLRVINQPHNNDALFRIINVPARGIGAVTAKSLLDDAEAKGTSLWSHLRDVAQGHERFKTRLSKAAEIGLGSLSGVIITSKSKILESGSLLSPLELLQLIIKKLDFKAYLEKSHSEDHEARWANIEELLAQASEFPVLPVQSLATEDDRLPNVDGLSQSEAIPAEEALSKFLANVALATELQREDEDPEDGVRSQVTISTIHAAKGLEWPVVFVPSAYEGSIPHSRAEDTDEERRLLYVAMTRAQALLYLSCPTKNSQKEDTTLSSFLSVKKISSYLTNRGPTINSGVVSDICRILNRDCPTQAHIVERSMNLPSRNDDLWPLSGKNDTKGLGARWSKWDDYGSQDHTAKRRRLKEGSFDDRADYSRVRSANYSMVSTIGTSTTMQNSSTFSCTGFVSATTQLKQIDNQIEHPAKTGTSSRSRSRRENNPTTKRNSQGNLTSFVGKTDSLACGGPEASMSKSGVDESCAEMMSEHDHPSISNQSLPAGRLQTARPALAAIPQAFSGHRLPTTSSTKRPLLDKASDGSAERPYVFLSSSPPPDNTQTLNGKNGHEHCLRPSEMQSTNDLHTTSFTQQPREATKSKKTLGVRRNMNGWPAKTDAGFSRPKKR